MNALRRVLAGTAIAAVGLGALATATTTSATAAPSDKLQVLVKTVDGKDRIKVKRKLAVGIACTKNCKVVVDMKLVTPDDTLKGRIKGGLKAFEPKAASFTLNTTAINYLRLAYPKSRFSIKVTATDISNGKRVIKRKVFRFRR